MLLKSVYKSTYINYLTYGCQVELCNHLRIYTILESCFILETRQPGVHTITECLFQEQKRGIKYIVRTYCFIIQKINFSKVLWKYKMR